MLRDPERFREADELLDYVEVPEPEPEPEIKHLPLPLHRAGQPLRPAARSPSGLRAALCLISGPVAHRLTHLQRMCYGMLMSHITPDSAATTARIDKNHPWTLDRIIGTGGKRTAEIERHEDHQRTCPVSYKLSATDLDGDPAWEATFLSYVLAYDAAEAWAWRGERPDHSRTVSHEGDA